MTKLWIKLAILFTLFLLPSVSWAQHTTVTAQVLDPTGILYRTCTGSANFIGQNTVPGAGPYLLGGSVFQTVVPISCDSFARFTISLADNNLITPTPSQWRFSLCSALGVYPGPPICFNALVTIAGTSEDITAALQAVSAPLPPSSILLETNGAANGSQTLLNLIAGTGITIVDDLHGNVTIAATGGGPGGGGTPGGSNGEVQWNNNGAFGGITNVVPGSRLASNGVGSSPVWRVNPEIDIDDFGAAGDGQVATDCYMTSGSATLNCASDHFVVGDVGKVIAVYENGTTTAGFVQPLSTTIIGFTSATQVTLNSNAANTTTSTVSSITAAARSNNVVTVTTGAAHNLSVGQVACLSSPPGTSLDRTILGCFTVRTTPSGTQFTINQWQELDNAAMTVTGGVEVGYSSRTVWGTNNDTALTNAADTCGDLGGCTLLIKAGHYLTHALNLPCSKLGNWTAASKGTCAHVHNNITVQGDGVDISTLENWDADTVIGSNPATNYAVIAIGAQADQYPYFGFTTGGPLAPITGLHITGLTLVQVKNATSSLKSFRSDSSDGLVIDHVKITGGSYEGFYFSGLNYDAHDLFASGVGLGGPALSTTTSAFNAIAGWGRVHDSYVTDSGQCIEAGNPHQWVYNIYCDGRGNDIFSLVAPHIAFNMSSNTFGTWDVHVSNNVFKGWAGAQMGNVNGIMKDVTFTDNVFIDDTAGIVLGTGKETNNVSVYPQDSPSPHGSSTCSNNTFVVTPNGRPGTYFFSLAGNIQPVLENWTCDGNRVVYTTMFCSTSPFQPTLDNSTCGAGVATIPNGIVNVSSLGAPVWIANHAYALNSFMMPTATATSKFMYIATVSGTSDPATEPTECTTAGCTFTDGSVTWKLYGYRPQFRFSRTTIQAPTNASSSGAAFSPEINIATTVPTDHQIYITDWQYNLQSRKIANGVGINIPPNTAYSDAPRTQIEGSAPAGSASVDSLWADSGNHRWRMNNNNGGAQDVLGANDWAVPGAIGSTTPSTGKFTTVQSTVATGTAPLIVASTTNVANLNASSLSGATFAAPGPIGGGTPDVATFTTVTANSSNGGISGTEGTGAGVPAGAGLDVMWPDSTAHRWLMNNNNGGNQNVIGTFDFQAVYNHSGTQQTTPHLVQDSCTLGTDCSVTLTGASVYTSSTSYTCACVDATAINACRVNQTSASAFAITGTGTDVIRYLCVGN